MEVTTIGIDLAKSVFAVSGADRRGQVIVRRQLRRAQVDDKILASATIVFRVI